MTLVKAHQHIVQPVLKSEDLVTESWWLTITCGVEEMSLSN